MTDAQTLVNRRNLVRRLRANRFSVETIVSKVAEKYGEYSERTLYRDIRVISRSAGKWARETAYEGMADQFRLSVETIEAAQANLAAIMQDEKATPRDKIEANRAMIEGEVTRINLLGYTADVAHAKPRVNPETEGV